MTSVSYSRQEILQVIMSTSYDRSALDNPDLTTTVIIPYDLLPERLPDNGIIYSQKE